MFLIVIFDGGSSVFEDAIELQDGRLLTSERDSLPQKITDWLKNNPEPSCDTIKIFLEKSPRRSKKESIKLKENFDPEKVAWGEIYTKIFEMYKSLL
jgi:hypothetical protein